MLVQIHTIDRETKARDLACQFEVDNEKETVELVIETDSHFLVAPAEGVRRMGEGHQ